MMFFFFFFLFFFQKILTIYIKCQVLFSGKSKKNIARLKLLSVSLMVIMLRV